MLLVHQRLGPPINQERRESFQIGQQNQQNQNFSNRNSEATVKQNVLQTDIPTNKGESLSHLKRRLDLLKVPAGNEEKPIGVRLARSVQAWQNLLGKCRSSRILRSGVLLEWDSLSHLTRTLRQFLTKNKTEYLQKAMDSLLKKGSIEPVPRSLSLDFISRLFLDPKKTGVLCPMIDLSTLNRHLVVPHF